MVSVTATPPHSDGSVAKEMRSLLWTTLKSSPWPTVVLLIATIIANLRMGVFVIAIGQMTQAFIDRDRTAALVWSLVFFATNMVENIYWPLKSHLSSMIEDSATVSLQTRVMQRTATVPLELYENETFFSRLQRANDDLGIRFRRMLGLSIDFIQVVIMLVGALAPVWFVDPRIVLVQVLAGIPIFVSTWSTAGAFHVAKTRHAKTQVYASKIRDLIMQRDAAAEIRLFGTGKTLIDRWFAAKSDAANDAVQAVSRQSMRQFAGEASAAIGTVISVLLLVQTMLRGDAQLGSLVAVMFALVYISQFVAGTAHVIWSMREDSLFLGDIVHFEQSAPVRPVSTSTQNCGNAPMQLDLNHAAFRYPGAENDTVRDLTLSIPPGQHVALVGANGAGKSTLVRLICGLYAPTTGSVDLDGAPATDQQRDIGTVFQDFVRWQMPLRENVGFGDVDSMDDDTAIISALEKSDLGSLPDEMEHGIDSWLGREFGDRDLSGGQWQRVAIARAFFRNARLLILDEPTAALDPLAEQRLFERFRDLAADKTAITISHRIGPARSADRILVMDAGQIVEDGAHDELMALDGRYAEMFRSQQEWYNHSNRS